MGEIEKACREMGLTHLFLMTGKDVPTFSFYNKLGFRAAENMVAFAKDLRNK
ncbi:MAG: hypothetical protein HFJ89_03530 [Oscillospiraceae bacterium]|nr:hypothetical protein [Oscillospiraceae bacterium]